MSRSAARIAVFSLAMLAPLCAQAQRVRGGHTGFHASVGLGAGSVGTTCDGCAESRTDGGAIMMRFGGAIRPGVVLSGEMGGWARDTTQGRANTSWLMAVAQFYPEPVSGFFVKTGLGLGGTSTLVGSPTGLRTVRTSTIALGLGAGYDIAIRGGFALTPYLDVVSIPEAEARSNGSTFGPRRGGNLVYLGLAASWR